MKENELITDEDKIDQKVEEIWDKKQRELQEASEAWTYQNALRKSLNARTATKSPVETFKPA